MPRRLLSAAVSTALALVLLAAAPAAQSASASPEAKGKSAAIHRKPFGAPPAGTLPPKLPALHAKSPPDTLLYADRVEVEPPEPPPGALPLAGGSVEVTLDGQATGTGKAEVFRFAVPPLYDPAGPARPLLVAYHGFGQSALSVETQTTLDEECAVRGWLYMAPTGIDDKLFGSPVSQANVEAAMLWMVDNHAVDLDRIYMVGFSMGAGIVGNFAARRRDPAGLMIAGLGFVCGSYDWTQTYALDPAIRPWLENPFNFGSSPALAPFAYQRASALHLAAGSYPPTPGTLVPARTMASNLEHVPVYVTWDVGDPIVALPAQNAVLAQYLGSRGTVASLPVAGTVDPASGAPATHSWAVLDETALCDFLAPLSVVRVPTAFDALLDDDGAVAFARVVQAAGGAFSAASGTRAAPAGPISLVAGENVAEIAVDGTQAGVGVWPVPIVAAPSGGELPVLRLTNFATPPGYLTAADSGLLVPGLESDPATDSLLVALPSPAGLSVLAHSVPWLARVSLLPDPALPADALTLAIDARPGSTLAWLVLGMTEAIYGIKGGLLLGVPPLIVVPVPLDAAGDATLGATLSGDPALSGARLLLQAAVLGAGGVLEDASNVFAFDVQ